MTGKLVLGNGCCPAVKSASHSPPSPQRSKSPVVRLAGKLALHLFVFSVSLSSTLSTLNPMEFQLNLSAQAY